MRDGFTTSPSNGAKHLVELENNAPPLGRRRPSEPTSIPTKPSLSISREKDLNLLRTAEVADPPVDQHKASVHETIRGPYKNTYSASILRGEIPSSEHPPLSLQFVLLRP